MARQKSNCTSRPDCPAISALRCAEKAEGKTEKDEQNKIPGDFFARYGPSND